jgi:hypothetical protein
MVLRIEAGECSITEGGRFTNIAKFEGFSGLNATGRGPFWMDFGTVAEAEAWTPRVTAAGWRLFRRFTASLKQLQQSKVHCAKTAGWKSPNAETYFRRAKHQS